MVIMRNWPGNQWLTHWIDGQTVWLMVSPVDHSRFRIAIFGLMLTRPGGAPGYATGVVRLPHSATTKTVDCHNAIYPSSRLRKQENNRNLHKLKSRQNIKVYQ